MAVTFDQHTSSPATGSGVTTITQSFTIGSVTNGAAVAALNTNSATAISAITATWNGTSMSQITGTLITSGAGVSGCLVLFGITAAQVSPFTGTHNLVFNWTSSGIALCALASFGGANQTGGSTTFINGTTNDNLGNTASSTVSVTTANGNATVSSWNPGQQFTGTQTPATDWQVNVAGFTIGEGQHILSTTTSDSYTATMAGTDDLVFSGCCIVAAAAGGDVLSAQTMTRSMIGWRRRRNLLIPAWNF